MHDTNTIQIFVQASKYDADYLEHRINEFLKSYCGRDDEGNIITRFTENSIKINEENIIKSLTGE